jgi:hypothetical protein
LPSFSALVQRKLMQLETHFPMLVQSNFFAQN